jgi:hypothetical protein
MRGRSDLPLRKIPLEADHDLDWLGDVGVWDAVAAGADVDEPVGGTWRRACRSRTGIGFGESTRSACTASRSKQFAGASCVVPWTR